MERIVFIVERSGLRIPCMLNPEEVVLRRRPGIVPRRTEDGPLLISDVPADPLIFTGGGYTEMTLNLLFDVSLAAPPPPSADVRAMTGPLWRASETAEGAARGGFPPLLRFFWGKAWNLLGVISAMSERLENFTAAGEPRRSWFRLRFVAVPERAAAPGAAGPSPAPLAPGPAGPGAVPSAAPAGPAFAEMLQGGEDLAAAEALRAPGSLPQFDLLDLSAELLRDLAAGRTEGR